MRQWSRGESGDESDKNRQGLQHTSILVHNGSKAGGARVGHPQKGLLNGLGWGFGGDESIESELRPALPGWAPGGPVLESAS
ncbi:MAG: hypothetical protein Kow001_12190 [Acidobacteriota bacterium]